MTTKNRHDVETASLPEEELSKFRTYLEAVLKSELRIKVDRGSFTDPNNRVIQVFLGKKLITEASFDVVQKEEYGDY